VSPREERRARLLEAARAVVLRFGYRKAGLEDVAREAGVSRATVYNYFPNKEMLFRAIVAEELERLRLAVAEAVDLRAEPAAQLLSYVRARGAQLERIRSFYVLRLNVGRDVLPIVEDELGALRAQERAFLEAILRAGIARGSFRSVEPGALAAALAAAFRGLEEEFVFEHGQGSAAGSELLLRTLLEGLSRPPVPSEEQP